MAQRMSLDQIGVGAGKKARLHRILFRHGLGNGTAIFLPYDQGLEHGPRDFFANPAASDPRYIIKLALEGGFNGIALQIGLAEKFYWDYAGEVPLILKLNGKTEIPSDEEALSPVHASVADAVRLGADAVGYTLYVGTPAQEPDFAQLRPGSCRRASSSGMPLIVWAYPRGSAIEAKGGKDSFYAVTTRLAPRASSAPTSSRSTSRIPRNGPGVAAAYDAEFSTQQAVDAVVRSANRTLVLISGGEQGRRRRDAGEGPRSRWRRARPA